MNTTMRAGMIIACFVLIGSSAKATLPVVDIAGNVQNEINAIAAYIKQGMQYVQEQTTALKEIQ